MKEIPVRQLMIPLEEYSTVAHDASLSEAVQVLAEAQKTRAEQHSGHRSILVCDDGGKV